MALIDITALERFWGRVKTWISEKYIAKGTGKDVVLADGTTIPQSEISGGGGGTTIVQADWNETDEESSKFINNKPTIPTKVSDLQNDSQFITATEVNETLLGKVDKEAGKGLSTNDYTTADKNKVASALPFNNTYCSNANTHLDNGYIKVGKYSGNNFTQNIPSVCTGDDRWGILFFIAENVTDGTGTQMYFPIDGTYKGRVFTRSLTAAKKTGQSNYNIGEWALLATSKDLSGYVKSEAISDMLTKTEANDKYLGKLASASSATKLANARTLWGQSFDGTADVSGAMSGVTSINHNSTEGVSLGYACSATGLWGCVAIGSNTQASGNFGCVAIGRDCKATAIHGAVWGLGLTSNHRVGLHIGKYNAIDTSADIYGKNAFCIGNGTSDTARSNAMTIDWNGNQFLQGGLAMNGVLSGARGDVKGVSQLVKGGIDDYTLLSGTSATMVNGKIRLQSNGSMLGMWSKSLIANADTKHRYLIVIRADMSNYSETGYSYCQGSSGRNITTPFIHIGISDRMWMIWQGNGYIDLDSYMALDLTQMFGQSNEPTTATEFANRLGYASIEDVPYIPYGTTELSNAMAIGGDLVVNGTPLRGDMIATKTGVENTTETTKVLEVGKVVNFGEVQTLNITLAEPTQTDVVNEYGFVFTAGVSNMTYTLPTSVKWEVRKGAPTITEGHTYRVTIIDNCATYNEFE